MPSVLMDRLPLPSLQTYTSISILLLSSAIYYSLKVISQPGWSMNILENVQPSESGVDSLSPVDSSRILLHKLLMNNMKTKRLFELSSVMLEEPLCIWTLINMVYCVMILIGKCIQKMVFGDLRVIELQHIKDKFWNFVFYKFIFIFGVMNVQNMDEVIMWCGWFSFVGAFHLLSTLCKDRFEYLSFSPTTPKRTHLRLFSLIFFILAVSVSLCTLVGLYASANIFFFMAAEWTLVIIRTLYVLVRYIIHLYDVTHEGIWEKRGIYTYYAELGAELGSLGVDFLHHLHMLLWRNIFVSVASLVICMQLRVLINDMQRKITRHKNYLRVSRHMESNFPLATREEIDANSDDCAICWDRMESARKLPCGHMFHSSCLHSWLEQVTNCPTCRTSLVPKHPSDGNRNMLDPQQPPQTMNHFFHFDGSRYVSWLPSFSVEVSHSSLLGDRPTILPPIRTSQFDGMVSQIVQMFPHMPYNTVLADLLVTHSVEQTIENILEERLVAPPPVNTPTTPAPNPPALFNNSMFNLFFNGNRSPSSVTVAHPTPLTGSSPDVLHLRESPQREGDSSDSGVSDNTVKTEESAIMTGGDGCRFSKNSSERENMLSIRKEEHLRKARNKYISRMLSSSTIDEPSTSGE